MERKANKTIKILCVAAAALFAAGAAGAANHVSAETETPLDLAKRVYDSYLETYREYRSIFGTNDMEWTDATFQLGALALYERTENEAIYADVVSRADKRSWQLSGTDTAYPDALGYSMVYAELCRFGEERGMSGIKKQLNYNLDRGFLDYSRIDRFWYLGDACILLSEKTGNAAYRELDFASYKFTRETLFDFEEGLFYRDSRYVYEWTNPLGQSFDGEKVFLSRANGAAYASLASRLAALSPDDPSYSTYLYDFLAMSDSICARQREDGLWNPDLGNSMHRRGKESSGTAAFLYGISTGIKLGLLGDSYRETADKAYAGLVSVVTDEGKVGYCLPYGADATAYVEAELGETTNTYATGMFLLGVCAYADII